MNKYDAIELAGGAQRLAAVLGISHQAVYAWPDEIPAMRVFQLRVLRPAWFRKRRSSDKPRPPRQA